MTKFNMASFAMNRVSLGSQTEPLHFGTPTVGGTRLVQFRFSYSMVQLRSHCLYKPSWTSSSTVLQCSVNGVLDITWAVVLKRGGHLEMIKGHRSLRSAIF